MRQLNLSGKIGSGLPSLTAFERYERPVTMVHLPAIIVFKICGPSWLNRTTALSVISRVLSH